MLFRFLSSITKYFVKYFRIPATLHLFANSVVETNTMVVADLRLLLWEGLGAHVGLQAGQRGTRLKQN